MTGAFCQHLSGRLRDNFCGSLYKGGDERERQFKVTSVTSDKHPRATREIQQSGALLTTRCNDTYAYRYVSQYSSAIRHMMFGTTHRDTQRYFNICQYINFFIRSYIRMLYTWEVQWTNTDSTIFDYYRQVTDYFRFSQHS